MDPGAVIRLLDDPRIVELSEKARRGPAQVVLRWHIQHGQFMRARAAAAKRQRESA
jgi:diketogulonate reductase-like aldo/keto reductase